MNLYQDFIYVAYTALHFELLGQFHERLPDGGERDLRLESGAMAPSVVVLSWYYLLFPASKPISGKNSTYPSALTHSLRSCFHALAFCLCSDFSKLG
jgi:hypothetical protein